jgi:thiamine-monophosphate kinase
LGGILRETEFIRSLSGLDSGGEGIGDGIIGTSDGIIGIGDDAALFGGYLISKDLLVEGVHFLLEEGAERIARRLIASNISDICAMGGKRGGYYALLGAGLSSGIDASAFSAAFSGECARYGVRLLGGDTVSSPTAFFSMTIIGSPNKFVLRRSGAKAGDIVYLSRPVGLAGALLENRLAGNFAEDDDFPPETALGELLGGAEGATACIDISDGLGIDLARVAEASKAAIHIFSKNIPLGKAGLSTISAARSGEEYALAFTVSKDRAEYIEEIVQKGLNRKIYRIGEVLQGTGVFMDGEDISGWGYEHKF